MRYDIVVIVGIAVFCCSVVLLAVLYLVDKENKKHLREMVEGTRKDWAMAFDAAELLRDKESDALKYALSCKDTIIKEKDERIKDLENQIAINEMVMNAVKLSDLDSDQLKLLVDSIKMGKLDND